MATQDFIAYVQERVANFDSSLDTAPGSPFYEKVIQKVVDRIGTDPFTVDTQTFIRTTVAESYPTLTIGRGDALTDIFINASSLLIDPLVRESKRIALQQSLGRADLLTTEEVTALGANLFEPIRTGTKSRVTVRVFFAQPRPCRVNSANYVFTSSNLRFFPIEAQEISPAEMLLNVSGSSYYFDIHTVAENPGSEYEIEKESIVGINGVLAAVRVTNLTKASIGLDAETPEQYAQRLESSQSDKSLVTARGIVRVLSDISDVSRVAVAGYGDPEMKRDVIYGGGYSAPEMFGNSAVPVPDATFSNRTTRVQLNDFSDLYSVVAPTLHDVDGWSLTIVNAFGGVGSPIRDLKVTSIISSNTLEVSESVLVMTYPASGYFWALRRNGITISKIPGGITNPDNPAGTVLVKKDEVHIGGVYDVFLRGSSFTAGSLRIDALVDDASLDRGVDAGMVVANNSQVELYDRVLGTDFAEADETYQAFAKAAEDGWSLVLDEGAIAGAYLVLGVTQDVGQPVRVVVHPPVNPALIDPSISGLRWRLSKDITVDLNVPKITKVRGDNLSTTQGSVLVEDSSFVDLLAFGASQGDTLEILTGNNKGTYTLASAPIAPFYNRVSVTTPLARTSSGQSYVVYRANTGGGIELPLVRVKSIDLLDTSGGVVGTSVPYAKTLGAFSTSFSNLQTGTKFESFVTLLGIVSSVVTTIGDLAGRTLSVSVEGVPAFSVSLGSPLTLAAAANTINTVAGKLFAQVIDGNRLAFSPLGTNTAVAVDAYYANGLHFSGALSASSRLVRTELPGVDLSTLLVPIIASVDVLQVMTGAQLGFYEHPVVVTGASLTTDHDFFPEINAHVVVGSRSLGSARMYFLEPTTVVVNGDTLFEAQTDVGVLSYRPDTTLEAVIVPAPPAEDTPGDGVTSTVSATVSKLTSSIDFRRRRVRIGDVLEITRRKVTLAQALTDPVLTLVGKKIRLSYEGGQDKDIIFVNDSAAIPSTAVTRSGVAAQINQALGVQVCRILEVSGSFYLQFDTDKLLQIRPTGTANALLGLSTTLTTNNNALTAGKYTVAYVGGVAEGVHVNAVLAAESFVYFRITRKGEQRFTATEMQRNVDSLGFYYIDVELVSYGTGDAWNISSGTSFKVDGYRSDGYYLVPEESGVTFSTQEKLSLRLSATMLDVGNNDSEESRTQLAGQSVQINYDYAPTVATAQSLLNSEIERTVNANPLARHLYPHFVRTLINYRGGSQSGVIVSDIEKYILETYPAVPLDAAEFVRRVQGRSSTSVEVPIEIAAVVHNEDRSVTLERSKGTIGTTRFASYWPESINLSRTI